jgi:glycosyltransferase involved in cell wall biosynthesis
VPVYNRPDMLRQAVASVIAQTYDDFEIIIVDDESTDDTPQVIDELRASDPRIRSVRRPNGGPGLARESGRLASEGVHQYLDSDDLLLPRKLELQVAALRANPDAGVAYGRVIYRDADKREIECDWKPANQNVPSIFPSFLIARWWETVSPLFRRSVTDAAGPWTSLRLEEDWEYDTRVGSLGVKLVFVEAPVGEHRDHPEDRLSRGAGGDPRRLRDRAEAHVRIAAHARQAGVDPGAPEFQTFARELFHIARQCGAAGLVDDSKRLLKTARDIADGRDLRVYARGAPHRMAQRGTIVGPARPRERHDEARERQHLVRSRIRRALSSSRRHSLQSLGVTLFEDEVWVAELVQAAGGCRIRRRRRRCSLLLPRMDFAARHHRRHASGARGVLWRRAVRRAAVRAAAAPFAVRLVRSARILEPADLLLVAAQAVHLEAFVAAVLLVLFLRWWETRSRAIAAALFVVAAIGVTGLPQP